MAKDKTAVQLGNRNRTFRLFGPAQVNFNRYGYHLNGWKKTPGPWDGEEYIYPIDAVVSWYPDVADSIDSNSVNLYAVWGRDSYDVTISKIPSECEADFYGFGSYEYEKIAILSVVQPWDENYGFLMWNFPDGRICTEISVEFEVLQPIQLSAVFKDLRTIWMKSRAAAEHIWRYKDLPAGTDGVLTYKNGNAVAEPFSHDVNLNDANMLYQLSVIEENITSINDFSFSKCEGLVSAECPYVKTVQRGAFSECGQLRYINMDSVTDIGASAFNSCSSLISAVFPELTSAGTEVFSGCRSISSIYMPKLLNVPDGAFTACSSLSEITLPELISVGRNIFNHPNVAIRTPVTLINFQKLQDIGPSAFYGCDQLVHVIGLNNVVSVGVCSFQGCSSLTSINIQSVKDIGASAFSDCSQLTSISMSCVSAICQNAFQNCENLARLNFGYSSSCLPPSIDNSDGGIFKGIDFSDNKKISCYVPAEDSVYLQWITHSVWGVDLSDNIQILKYDL